MSLPFVEDPQNTRVEFFVKVRWLGGILMRDEQSWEISGACGLEKFLRYDIHG